jgi:hypothetical protein
MKNGTLMRRSENSSVNKAKTENKKKSSKKKFLDRRIPKKEDKKDFPLKG